MRVWYFPGGFRPQAPDLDQDSDEALGPTSLLPPHTWADYAPPSRAKALIQRQAAAQPSAPSSRIILGLLGTATSTRSTPRSDSFPWIWRSRTLNSSDWSQLDGTATALSSSPGPEDLGRPPGEAVSPVADGPCGSAAQARTGCACSPAPRLDPAPATQTPGGGTAAPADALPPVAARPPSAAAHPEPACRVGPGAFARAYGCHWCCLQ